jgi:hypothetical protein
MVAKKVVAKKKVVANKTKTAWSRKDVRGPAESAPHVTLAKVADLKINEFGFRPRRPMLGGVPEGPIHLRPAIARPLPGAGGGGAPGPGGAPCPVNVTKSSGGKILSNPKVVLMWWSTYFWDRHTTERNYYKAALNAFANDAAFWSRLSEYGITGGSYGGSIDLTRFGGPSASVSESAIQAALTFRFDNLATPPDSNSIYVVMLPNGISSAYDTSNGFIGHHQTYKYKSTDIYYSVVEYSADKNRSANPRGL